jgi:UDP-3-O-[3-hydroxymyristoyl] glucosamine N-acyltransferase
VIALSNEFASVASDVKLGKNVRLGKFINLYGCEVGDDTKIGAFVEIQKNASVVPGRCVSRQRARNRVAIPCIGRGAG